MENMKFYMSYEMVFLFAQSLVIGQSLAYLLARMSIDLDYLSFEYHVFSDKKDLPAIISCFM